MTNKKAVSPLISTVLLIMIVIVLALIIIFWSIGFVKEAIEKTIDRNKKRVNEYCNEVSLKSIVNPDGKFGFENVGNVPIYGFNLKLSGGGRSQTLSFPGKNVNPGFGIIIDSSLDSSIGIYDSYNEVKVIPILLGTKERGGNEEFHCPEENAFTI
ncbi:hypothetical protein J4221_05375 [Candidatus Pacearchaeota archaeon]|nr:hypothetical protein [Candidatus Pacearchaeota archaeon]